MKPAGQVIHTSTNAIMPTANKHAVSMETEMLCNAISEGPEVVKKAAPGFLNNSSKDVRCVLWLLGCSQHGSTVKTCWYHSGR